MVQLRFFGDFDANVNTEELDSQYCSVDRLVCLCVYLLRDKRL